MSDCPASGHGHELAYKNRYRILSDARLAQSCYCIHCGDEMRRVYVRATPVAAMDGILTDDLIVTGPERVLRRGGPTRSAYVAYTASHVEGRPLAEPGTVSAITG